MTNIVARLLPIVVVPLVLMISLAIFTDFSTNLDRGDWGTAANASYSDIEDGTYDGFNLAGLLPFVIIAMIMLGLLIGAFAGVM